jgi:hypothetical protein
MRLKSGLYALLALGMAVAVVGCIIQPVARPPSAPAAAVPAGPSPAARAAIAEAEKALADVKMAGHEWRLIDKATGPDSETLTKLLDKAKELGGKGENDEAIRVARRVKDAAALGLQQAADSVNAKPFYPK